MCVPWFFWSTPSLCVCSVISLIPGVLFHLTQVLLPHTNTDSDCFLKFLCAYIYLFPSLFWFTTWYMMYIWTLWLTVYILYCDNQHLLFLMTLWELIYISIKFGDRFGSSTDFLCPLSSSSLFFLLLSSPSSVALLLSPHLSCASSPLSPMPYRPHKYKVVKTYIITWILV